MKRVYETLFMFWLFAALLAGDCVVFIIMGLIGVPMDEVLPFIYKTLAVTAGITGTLFIVLRLTLGSFIPGSFKETGKGKLLNLSAAEKKARSRVVFSVLRGGAFGLGLFGLCALLWAGDDGLELGPFLLYAACAVFAGAVAIELAVSGLFMLFRSFVQKTGN